MGEAYFAISPKAAMGGGSLSAIFELGPVSAHFDAYADFLINFSPFTQLDGNLHIVFGTRPQTTGNRKGSRRFHRWVSQKFLLELRRVDVFASSANDILQATDKIYISIIINRGQVASVKPEIPKGSLICSMVIEIAIEKRSRIVTA